MGPAAEFWDCLAVSTGLLEQKASSQGNKVECREPGPVEQSASSVLGSPETPAH